MTPTGVDHLTGATVADAPPPCRECMWWQTRPGREPGERRRWIESAEEEFVYVIDGEIDAWIDGELHRMRAGDFAAFPAGTGICHTFINDGDRDALLLVGGEADKAENRIHYPLHPGRRNDMPWSRWWDDVPARPQGAHDGEPHSR